MPQRVQLEGMVREVRVEFLTVLARIVHDPQLALDDQQRQRLGRLIGALPQ